jgi:hypothetical protein
MIYQLMRKTRKPATIVKRQQIIDYLTGQVSVVEDTWSGEVGFVENSRMPQQDLVVVADAWIITERRLDDKMIVHCQGRSYSVLKIADHGKYHVTSLKAVARESYRELRADMVLIGDLDSDVTQEFHNNVEFIDELSSVLE